jgi:hypothetical protein
MKYFSATSVRQSIFTLSLLSLSLIVQFTPPYPGGSARRPLSPTRKRFHRLPDLLLLPVAVKLLSYVSGGRSIRDTKVRTSKAFLGRERELYTAPMRRRNTAFRRGYSRSASSHVCRDSWYFPANIQSDQSKRGSKRNYPIVDDTEAVVQHCEVVVEVAVGF